MPSVLLRTVVPVVLTVLPACRADRSLLNSTSTSTTRVTPCIGDEPEAKCDKRRPEPDGGDDEYGSGEGEGYAPGEGEGWGEEIQWREVLLAELANSVAF